MIPSYFYSGIFVIKMKKIAISSLVTYFDVSYKESVSLIETWRKYNLVAELHCQVHKRVPTPKFILRVYVNRIKDMSCSVS